MEDLAPFQGGFPEAKDGEKERFQGDQQGQRGLEGKALEEIPAETEHGGVFKQQVTLHGNRKNEAKWERCEPT